MLYHYKLVLLLIISFGIGNGFLFAKLCSAKKRYCHTVPVENKQDIVCTEDVQPKTDLITCSPAIAADDRHESCVAAVPVDSVVIENAGQPNDAGLVSPVAGDLVAAQSKLINKVDDIATKKPRSCQIRVLLDEAVAETPGRVWRISAHGGGILVDEHGKQPNLSFLQDMTTISYKSDGWYIGSRQVKTDRLLIRPRDGSIMCDGVAYYGSLYLVIEAEKNRALLINCLDLEDYVYSVLNREGFPGWKPEMNKVLAVAIRTYAAEMIFKLGRKNRPYHIRNTNIHQVYGGKPCSLELRRAVDDTRGIILTYDDKPIIAMYDICCGGIIPSLTNGINFKKAPYLARTKACKYCEGLKDCRWQVNLAHRELEAVLKQKIPRLGRLRHVRIARKDKAGMVKEVEILGRGGVFRLPGKKFYAMIKGAFSACFTIEEKGRMFVFKGRGYGHQMGLCQLGASRMVKAGHNFKQVLSFYYPGARFMKIKDRTAVG